MISSTNAMADSAVLALGGLLVEGADRERRAARSLGSSTWRRLIGALAWQLKLRLVNVVAMSAILNKTVRGWLLRLVGYDVRGAQLEWGSIIRARSLAIGAGSVINHGCFFSNGDIVIGRNVGVSVGVTLLTGNHAIGPSRQRVGADTDAPIIIDDGSWVGANVTVLSGVRIARGCIIGAGAVVTKDTEPDGVYTGVPARRVRDLV